jgi:hypothetical protein
MSRSEIPVTRHDTPHAPRSPATSPSEIAEVDTLDVEGLRPSKPEDQTVHLETVDIGEELSPWPEWLMEELALPQSPQNSFGWEVERKFVDTSAKPTKFDEYSKRLRWKRVKKHRHRAQSPTYWTNTPLRFTSKEQRKLSSMVAGDGASIAMADIMNEEYLDVDLSLFTIRPFGLDEYLREIGHDQKVGPESLLTSLDGKALEIEQTHAASLIPTHVYMDEEEDDLIYNVPSDLSGGTQKGNPSSTDGDGPVPAKKDQIKQCTPVPGAAKMCTRHSHRVKKAAKKGKDLREHKEAVKAGTAVRYAALADLAWCEHKNVCDCLAAGGPRIHYHKARSKKAEKRARDRMAESMERSAEEVQGARDAALERAQEIQQLEIDRMLADMEEREKHNRNERQVNNQARKVDGKIEENNYAQDAASVMDGSSDSPTQEVDLDESKCGHQTSLIFDAMNVQDIADHFLHSRRPFQRALQEEKEELEESAFQKEIAEARLKLKRPEPPVAPAMPKATPWRTPYSVRLAASVPLPPDDEVEKPGAPPVIPFPPRAQVALDAHYLREQKRWFRGINAIEALPEAKRALARTRLNISILEPRRLVFGSEREKANARVRWEKRILEKRRHAKNDMIKPEVLKIFRCRLRHVATRLPCYAWVSSGFSNEPTRRPETYDQFAERLLTREKTKIYIKHEADVSNWVAFRTAIIRAAPFVRHDFSYSADNQLATQKLESVPATSEGWRFWLTRKNHGFNSYSRSEAVFVPKEMGYDRALEREIYPELLRQLVWSKTNKRIQAVNGAGGVGKNIHKRLAEDMYREKSGFTFYSAKKSFGVTVGRGVTAVEMTRKFGWHVSHPVVEQRQVIMNDFYQNNGGDNQVILNTLLAAHNVLIFRGYEEHTQNSKTGVPKALS